MNPNPIVRWVVRRPGCVAWSEHRTERAAHGECANANRICAPGHVVYATHKDGSSTGPYPYREEA